MAEAEKDSKPKKKVSADKTPIIDIAPPGTTEPSPTAKPIIIPNHRPRVQDPMVVTMPGEDNETSAAEQPSNPEPSSEPPKLTAPSHAKVVIAPLNDIKMPEAEDANDSPSESKPEAESKALPDASPVAASEPANLSDTPPEPDKVTDSVTTEESAPHLAAVGSSEEATESTAINQPEADTKIDSSADDTSPESQTNDSSSGQSVKDGQDSESAEAENEAEAKHDAEIQSLIDSKQYYLRINSREVRRAKRFVVLGIVLSLLLAAAWVDIALDAGLLHLDGVKPLTHFFSNN